MAGSGLVEFAFVSRVAADLCEAGVLRLARQTWRHNTEAGLTGTMRLEDGEISQVVEGSVEVVLPLASRILADSRHGSIRVLAFGPIAARRYEGWRVDGLAAPMAPGAQGSPDVICLLSRAEPVPDAKRDSRCARGA